MTMEYGGVWNGCLEMNSRQVIQLEFFLEAGDFSTAGEASSQIKRILQQIGVKAETARRIAIGAYEAEMNVIIHSLGGKMRVAILPDRTDISVEDNGPGIADVKLAMQEGYSTAPDHIRDMGFGAGMGLPNMARCSDEFSITSEVGVGTKIRMVIHHP
ncbi:MAG: spoIIAB 1 [Firmicutes bacterium]|nr:spoIIAB 1 [Bacillota bacterium]